MQTPTTFLFAGGGTGGHLFPGIAVAEELRRRKPSCQILFLGSDRDVEERILITAEFEHLALAAEPSTTLRRNPMRFAWRYLQSRRSGQRLLREKRPAAVIGLGGFASVSVVTAAASLHIPSVLLEQNTIPGRATRWLSRRASMVCLSFENSAQYLSKYATVRVTGNPVRQSVARLHHTMLLPTEKQPPTLLILGGSQGSHAVNEAVCAVVELMSDFLSNWRVVHQTGQSGFERVRLRYQQSGITAIVEPFFADPAKLYQHATLVVSRAGATTLAELACAGRPSVLIPYPHSVDDHQLSNAKHYEDAGAARIITQSPDAQTFTHDLYELLTSLLADSQQLDRMSDAMHALAEPQATRRVVDGIIQLADTGGNR